MLLSQSGSVRDKLFFILSDDKWEYFGLSALKFISSEETGMIFISANLRFLLCSLQIRWVNLLNSYQLPDFLPTKL